MTKVTVCISDPEALVSNGYMKAYCHNTTVLGEGDLIPETWITIGEVEYDEAVYIERCRDLALDALNKQEKRCRAEFSKDLDVIEIRKQNLLSLTHEVPSDA